MTRRRRERHAHRPHRTGARSHPPDPAHQADAAHQRYLPHEPYLPHQPYLPQFARWAAAIFAVAIAIRLAHVALLRSSPFFDVLLGDARGYDEWARRIAGGEWIGRDVFYQAPLYPYFLGLLYSIAGRDLLVVRIAAGLRRRRRVRAGGAGGRAAVRQPRRTGRGIRPGALRAGHLLRCAAAEVRARRVLRQPGRLARRAHHDWRGSASDPREGPLGTAPPRQSQRRLAPPPAGRDVSKAGRRPDSLASGFGLQDV